MTGAALRNRRAMVHIIWRDALKKQYTGAALSQLADVCVIRSISSVAVTRIPMVSLSVKNRGATTSSCIGMGKLGVELNLGSDIDLFVPRVAIRPARKSSAIRNSLLMPKLIQALDKQTVDGFVSVLICLRPVEWPLVMNFASIDGITKARDATGNAAMVKARVMTGEQSGSTGLLDILDPYLGLC